jgi:hypothetical protein
MQRDLARRAGAAQERLEAIARERLDLLAT